MFRSVTALLLLGCALLFVVGCSQSEQSPLAPEVDFTTGKSMTDDSADLPLGLDVPDGESTSGLEVSDNDPVLRLMGMALSPLNKIVLCGMDHTVSASVYRTGDQGSVPVAGQEVKFTITDGPNAGATATAVTDDLGRAVFTYNGAGGPGMDAIEIVASNTRTGESQFGAITVTWMAEAPTLEARYMPIFVYQENHKYITITPDMVIETAEDVFGNALDPAAVTVVSVHSDEPEDTTGDGSTMDDIMIECPNKVMLRTERMGGDQGRVYTIQYRLTDANGTSADDLVRVVILKDGSDKKTVSYHRDAGYTVTPECDARDYEIQF